jgi:opacity protein-like surface antigen
MRTLPLFFFAVLLLPAQTPDPAPAQVSDWKLGTLQTRILAGFNIQDSRDGAQPSAGGGLDIGLGRSLALATEYTWNRVGAASSSYWLLGHGVTQDVLIQTKSRSAMHDLMAGPRYRFHNATRVTPFGNILGGVVIVTSNASVNGVKILRGSISQPALGFGGGVEYHIGRGWSFVVEGKGIRPRDMNWYGTVEFGFAYRPGA